MHPDVDSVCHYFIHAVQNVHLCTFHHILVINMLIGASTHTWTGTVYMDGHFSSDNAAWWV